MAKKTAEKHLIVGAGEVGQALYTILKAKYDVAIRDVKDGLTGQFDVMHVTYPPFPEFVAVSKRYMAMYRPRLVIVHATVAPGTTAKLGPSAVHSPIFGPHFEFEKSIRTFYKYFGGPKAKQAATVFKALGIATRTFKKAETTELAKVLDTTYYGWNIVFAKEAKRIADRYGLDFDEVYTTTNTDYNESYRKLGITRVARPVLSPKPGSIGGHCIVPNCDLLDDWLTTTIKDRNRFYGKPAKRMSKKELQVSRHSRRTK